MQRVLDTLADTTEVDNLLYDFLVTFVARPHPSVVPATLHPADRTGALGLASPDDRRRSSPRPA